MARSAIGEHTKEGPNEPRPRRGLRGFIQRHPRISLSAVVLGVVFAVFVLLWFQPQKLFLNQTVNEAIPSLAPQDSAAPASPQAAEPTTLASGPFQSLEHETTGKAVLIELPDGSHILRFEDLETSNGPDLRVYLSEIPASNDWHAYGERFVDLGALKGNLGDQNYRVPRSVDLSKYRSAVIWCRRFTVGFGVAPLDRG
jgi:hypothetical protein